MNDNPAKVRYALGLLSSLEELREGNVVCDFAIKVGKESFPVHLTVLAASSKYFRAMAESRMIEVKQGFITMKDMEPNIIKICIKHMYSGEVELVSVPIESVLEAAHLMQLDDLVNSCFIHLQNNISAENCISTVLFSRLYDRQEIENLAEKYILRNLGEISQIESFSSISKDDLVRYISAAKVSYQVMWQAVVAWVHQKQENRDQLLVELMEVVKIEAFPFQFLFEKIVSEDLLKKSKPARDRLIKAMFSHEEVKSKFTIENVFTLRTLIQESSLAEKKDDGMTEKMIIIKDFMLENFEDLIEKEEFVQLDEDDILMFLRSPETKCSSEEFRWKAILKWTKFERKREKIFAKFFKLIHLKRVSNEFIRDNIRIEPIVKESTECLNMIVQAFCDRAESAKAEVSSTPCIAFLDGNDGGTVKVFDMNQASFRILSGVDNVGSNVAGVTELWQHCGIVNCNGEIYILIRQSLFKVDGDCKWTRLRPMPGKTGKNSHWPQIVALHGDIFVLMGSSLMVRYSIARNEWAVDLPGFGIDRRYCVASYETSLFAFGGMRDGEPSNEAKQFDSTKRRWYNLPPMQIKRDAASVATLHGLIFVAGGFDGYKRLNSVECFTHFTRSWTALPSMNSCHSGFTLLAICGKLYVCGGDINADADRYKNEGTVEIYNEDSAKWKTLKKERAFWGFYRACVYYPKENDLPAKK